MSPHSHSEDILISFPSRATPAGQEGGRLCLLSLNLDGNKLTDPLEIASTKNDADPLAWRQWHHWNVMKEMAVASFLKGKHVLTIQILTNGNMNLAYLDFKERKPADSNRASDK